jgi:hypothetical protein
MLGGLPGMIFVGELAYFWRRFAEGELCSCGAPLADCPFWSAVVGKAFGQMTRERASELNKLERQVTRLQSVLGLAPVAWSTRWSERIALMLKQRDQLCQAIGEVSNAEYIVDSGKGVVFGAIMARLNGIRFITIHLVRDPRGVAFSWQKHVQSDSEPRDMPRSSVLKTAGRWMLINLFVQFSLRRLGDGYWRIRYEDLLAHADNIASEISRVASSPLGSNASTNRTVQDANEHHLVAGNPGVRRRLGSDLRLTLDEEWRSQLPGAQQRVVVAVCGVLMAAYGYPLFKRRKLSGVTLRQSRFFAAPSVRASRGGHAILGLRLLRWGGLGPSWSPFGLVMCRGLSSC